MMKKYNVILADPPWQYSFSKSNSRAIEGKYPTMTTEEIKRMEIPAEENCILYLWATAPKLIDAIEVIKAWGFEYKTHAIWDKLSPGMGYWFRGRHEILIVAVKGEMSPPKQSKRVDSVFRIRRTEHSRKPEDFRALIDDWFPTLKKVELFARHRREGWDAWGNEVPNWEQKILRTK